MVEHDAGGRVGVAGLYEDPRRQAFAEVRAWALVAARLFRKNTSPVTRETVLQLLDGLAAWTEGEVGRGTSEQQRVATGERPGRGSQVQRSSSRCEEEAMSCEVAGEVPTEEEFRELEDIFSRMTAREFEEVVRRELAVNLDLLRPVSEVFIGRSVRDVTMWVVGLVVGGCRDFPVGARRIVAAMLRKGAEILEGDAGPGRADA